MFTIFVSIQLNEFHQRWEDNSIVVVSCTRKDRTNVRVLFCPASGTTKAFTGQWETSSSCVRLWALVSRLEQTQQSKEEICTNFVDIDDHMKQKYTLRFEPNCLKTFVSITKDVWPRFKRGHYVFILSCAINDATCFYQFNRG